MQSGGDTRGFYAQLGVALPSWAQTEAPVRCFAWPEAHANEDQHPSCSVNLESGAFNCHGCGARGGAYDAAIALGRSPREAIDLMVAHGLTSRRAAGRGARGLGVDAAARPRSAVRRVEQQAGPVVSDVLIDRWVRALAENDALLVRLRAERGWEPRTLRQLHVGFDGERITVPIRGEDGAAQGLLRLRVRASQHPKVLALAGTRLGLIPRPEAAAARVWLVEGPSDMLAARSAALPALAIPGTHAWRTEWASEFAGRSVIVAMDADRPGRQAALRIARDLERRGAAQVQILELAAERDDGYDLSDWLRHERRPAVRAHTSDEFRRMLVRGCGAAPVSSSVAGTTRGGGRRGDVCLRF